MPISDKWASVCCVGEVCRICKSPATHKVEEVIFDDDPNSMRHPLVAYVCCAHFSILMGPATSCFGRSDA